MKRLSSLLYYKWILPLKIKSQNKKAFKDALRERINKSLEQNPLKSLEDVLVTEIKDTISATLILTNGVIDSNIKQILKVSLTVYRLHEPVVHPQMYCSITASLI